MEINYNLFIYKLLSSSSANENDKKRIVSLLLKERDKGYVTEEQVREMIEQAKLSVESNSNVEKKKINITQPKQTYEFLSSFCNNDGGMKNLTHDFNYGYIDYDEFMSKCKQEFDEGLQKYPQLPIPLKTRIEQFAFSENPEWYIRIGGDKITINEGWSKPSFIEWYKKNKIHPSKDAELNKKMIEPFKNSIQVRADTQNLLALINSLKEQVFGKEVACCNITISEKVKTAQFYTDVDCLGQSLYQIFSTIKDISEKNFYDEVEIDYSSDDKFKVLTITHIGSEPTKNANDKDYEGGNTKAIQAALFGLCNYEIIANFPDGAYRKIILSDNYNEYKQRLYPISKESVKGYTHILKFY